MLWKGFQRPRHLEIDETVSNDTYGRFFAQPFERGFGTTVGNAMRRVLLSSIEGAAISAIRIEGVLHDRASYRYYWQLLERAHATGRTLPPEVQTWFVSSRC